MRRGTASALAVLALLGTGVAVATLGNGTSQSRADAAHAAAERFLDRYLAKDGRVVRRDQGNDTVGEGQAYAMLLTAATGDRKRFDATWDWTRRHLRRSDGLLAFRWADGHVVDPQAATDADLDTARALLIAGRRFHEPQLRREAVRIGRAILAVETARPAGRLVLVAGPWARDEAIFNPSYVSPRALAALARATNDPRFNELARTGRTLVGALQDHHSGLAPDWAKADSHGGATPIGTPAEMNAQARYGYDAMRIPARFGESCAAADRRRAAAAWRTLGPLAGGERIPPVLDLGGAPLAPGEHAASLANAAAAARAVGDRGTAAKLLDRATAADRDEPTYYGAAWTALARIMLDTELLGGC